MPIPKPRTNENQRDFIRRCYTEIKDEYKTAKALAICYDQFRNRNKTT